MDYLEWCQKHIWQKKKMGKLRYMHQRIDVLLRRGGKARDVSVSLCKHRGKAVWKHNKKSATYKPGREPSLDSEFASTLIMKSQLPELWEN